MKTTFIITAFAFIAALGSAYGQKPASEINYENFIKEITMTKADADHLRLSMWIPPVFWDIIGYKNKDLSGSMISDIKGILNEYTIFCIADADLKNPYNLEVSSDDAIRKSLFITHDGKKYKPLNESELSEAAVIMKSNIEPIFTSMMGNLGSGMKMYFFHINDKNNEQLLDPYKETSFDVSVSGHKLSYHLPFASLLEEKTCPVDGEKLQGNYNFCPYHGKPLK